MKALLAATLLASATLFYFMYVNPSEALAQSIQSNQGFMENLINDAIKYMR